MNGRSTLIVDISPLWEIQFTGIANVVFEITKRLLDEKRFRKIAFTIFHYEIDVSHVREAVEARSGANLRPLFNDVSKLKRAWDSLSPGEKSAGLFLHIRPVDRHYEKESQLYYDFSFLGMPEAHHNDTIEYHSKDLEQQVLANDSIFVISDSVARDLEFYFSYPVKQTHVVPLGFHVDTNVAKNFSALAEIRGCEPYFICVGTIEPRKNNRIILAWLKQNRKFLASYRFVFVGRDAWGDSFESLIKFYSLEAEFEARRIVHYGYVNEEQKTALIKGSLSVIYPSLFEGFGLPVLEAMALGAPVVASCSSSIPEVLGLDGNYFDPYDIDSFDSAMRRTLTEYGTDTGNEKLRRLQKRAELFSYDHCYEKIIGVLL